MRHLTAVSFAILLVGSLSIPALAQFQEPTADELHMTSDPKAPGAAAVYLYLEEKTDDAIHFHSYYARIKVLTEKGKELATVHVPYEHGQFQVAAIEGRTIHPDGSIVKLTAKPADLMAYRGGGHQYNQMTFTLPAAEVGSILEYRLQIRYSDDTVSSPQWLVQQQYYLHRAHYLFNPTFNVGMQVVDKHGQIADGLMYSTRLPYGGQVVRDSLHRYTLDVTDVPPLPTGDWLPPLNAIRESVIFYYTNANTGAEFWDREGRYWAKDAEHFTAASGPIKKAAWDLVAPRDPDETKARKIYAAVMKIDNRDFVHSTGGGSGNRANKDAAGVWKTQSGTADEIALTFVALARAAGLNANPMQVVNRDRAQYEPTYLSTDQFDDYIVIVQIDGKNVYLDPGQKMCAFGVLNWKHEIATGFRLSDKGAVIDSTPAGPPKAAEVERSADVTLDSHGAATGTARFVLSGQEALYWRQLSLVEDQAALAKDFSDYVNASLPDGLKGELIGFDGLNEYESSLTANLKLAGTIGSATGKRLILPGLLFASSGKHPFAEEESRSVPVDLHYATMEKDEVVYHLPSAMKLESVPRDPRVEWTSRIALSIEAIPSDGALTVKRTFIRTATLIEPSLYNNLRAIYRQISSADQQQIVLSQPAETASN